MYDTIIIGLGPAAVAAAIYAVRREMKTLVIGKEPGGQIVWAGEIENYPGFKTIMNYELIEKFNDHLKSAGVETIISEVQQVEKDEEGNFKVHTSKEVYSTKTVIVAMGLMPRRLAIKGEEKFSGKGISYCANCDGPLFKNKVVAVVGGGNSALDAAEVLSKIAKQVYLIHRSDKFKAFDSLVEEVNNRENIKVIQHGEVKEINGNEKVEKISVYYCETGITEEIEINGVFIEVGRIAHTDLLENLVERDQLKQVIVDDKCQTSTPGVFAAGDVTQVEFKQITVAMGQGTIAALTAYQYIQRKEGKTVTRVMDRSK